jgi:hypothetical protein
MLVERKFAHLSPDQVSFYDESLKKQIEGSYRDDHIKDLDCWGPDMLIFHGEDEGGRPIRLLQHYSQLSVLLCAVPREKDTEPKIGFVLHRRLKEL